MNTNFEFSDFMNEVHYQTKNQPIIEEIRYLVRAISVLEEKCKKIMNLAVEEFNEEYEEGRLLNPNLQPKKEKPQQEQHQEKEKQQEKQNINEEQEEQTPVDGNSGNKKEDGLKQSQKKDSSSQEKNNNQEENIPEKELPSPKDNIDETIDPILIKLIDKMYRKIALQYHPDKCGDQYRSIFVSATEASKERNLTKLLYIFGLKKIDFSFNEKELEFIHIIKSNLEKRLKITLQSPLLHWDTLPTSMKRHIARKLGKM